MSIINAIIHHDIRSPKLGLQSMTLEPPPLGLKSMTLEPPPLGLKSYCSNTYSMWLYHIYGMEGPYKAAS